MINTKIPWFHLACTFAALFFFQRLVSTVAQTIANLFNFSKFDPDHVFLSVSVHHVIQMMLALLAIYFISVKFQRSFHLHFAVSKTGVLSTLLFSIALCIYVLFSYVIGYRAGTIQPYNYPLTPTNVAGTLGFQLFLSGPSEEILFRALPITILFSLLERNTINRKNLVVILLSSVLFSLAHIFWDLNGITFDWFQLVYAFVLGVAYAVTYIKSQSIVYPMIMHSVSNVLMVGIGYLFMAFY